MFISILLESVTDKCSWLLNEYKKCTSQKSPELPRREVSVRWPISSAPPPLAACPHLMSGATPHRGRHPSRRRKRLPLVSGSARIGLEGRKAAACEFDEDKTLSTVPDVLSMGASYLSFSIVSPIWHIEGILAPGCVIRGALGSWMLLTVFRFQYHVVSKV